MIAQAQSEQAAKALDALARGADRTSLGYDATVDKSRRRSRSASLTSEDEKLTPQQRKKLLATTRDVHRNFTLARWAINKHLDYVSNFSFQARTGNEELNGRIEDLFEWWARPRNCDVAARHSLPRIVRLAEGRRTLDGDIFLLKLSDGRVQAIEADRVRTPMGGLPKNAKAKEFKHGVQADRFGRAKAYCVCKRTSLRRFAFERILRAEYVEHHGFFDRFDQLRGISPLAAAINTLQDTYEGFDYALAKMKVAQLFGLVFYREAGEPLGPVTGEDSDADGIADRGYKVDFGRGPVVLDLEPGDRAEFLDNKTPSTEFRDFSQMMIALALKALDIPYSFYDEAYTNYSGARQALLQYEQSAEVKRGDLRRVLDSLTAWRLRLFVEDGVLELPKPMAATDLRWEWVARGLPWIDPLKEVTADMQAISAGLASRTAVLKRQGREFADVVAELAAENRKLEEEGLPTKISPANVQIAEIAPEK